MNDYERPTVGMHRKAQMRPGPSVMQVWIKGSDTLCPPGPLLRVVGEAVDGPECWAMFELQVVEWVRAN